MKQTGFCFNPHEVISVVQLPILLYLKCYEIKTLIDRRRWLLPSLLHTIPRGCSHAQEVHCTTAEITELLEKQTDTADGSFTFKDANLHNRLKKHWTVQCGNAVITLNILGWMGTSVRAVGQICGGAGLNITSLFVSSSLKIMGLSRTYVVNKD